MHEVGSDESDGPLRVGGAMAMGVHSFRCHGAVVGLGELTGPISNDSRQAALDPSPEGRFRRQQAPRGRSETRLAWADVLRACFGHSAWATF